MTFGQRLKDLFKTKYKSPTRIVKNKYGQMVTPDINISAVTSDYKMSEEEKGRLQKKQNFKKWKNSGYTPKF